MNASSSAECREQSQVAKGTRTRVSRPLEKHIVLRQQLACSREACSLFILDKGKPVERPGRKVTRPDESVLAGVIAERVLAVSKLMLADREGTFDWNEEGRNINKWVGETARQASIHFR